MMYPQEGRPISDATLGVMNSKPMNMMVIVTKTNTQQLVVDSCVAKHGPRNWGAGGPSFDFGIPQMPTFEYFRVPPWADLAIHNDQLRVKPKLTILGLPSQSYIVILQVYCF